MPAALLDAPHVSEARGTIGAWQMMVADQDSAAEQMAMDEALARTARATFRLFRWKRPAVSLGFKQRPPAWVEPGALARHGIEVVERPTGGGIAVHGSDLSCSVVAPQEPRRTLASLMEGVCEALAQGAREFGAPVEWTPDARPSSRLAYCLTEPSPYALMVARRKLCGLAIRRYRTSWLVQGSVLVGALPAAFAQAMPADVFQAFQTRAITLEEAAGRPVREEDLVTALVGAWQRTWGARQASRQLSVVF